MENAGVEPEDDISDEQGISPFEQTLREPQDPDINSKIEGLSLFENFLDEIFSLF